jgi:hypothetical protein
MKIRLETFEFYCDFCWARMHYETRVLFPYSIVKTLNAVLTVIVTADRQLPVYCSLYQLTGRPMITRDVKETAIHNKQMLDVKTSVVLIASAYWHWLYTLFTSTSASTTVLRLKPGKQHHVHRPTYTDF